MLDAFEITAGAPSKLSESLAHSESTFWKNLGWSISMAPEGDHLVFLGRKGQTELAIWRKSRRWKVAATHKFGTWHLAPCFQAEKPRRRWQAKSRQGGLSVTLTAVAHAFASVVETPVPFTTSSPNDLMEPEILFRHAKRVDNPRLYGPMGSDKGSLTKVMKPQRSPWCSVLLNRSKNGSLKRHTYHSASSFQHR